MQRAISSSLLPSLLIIVCSGCGTLRPDSSVSVDPSISWSDLREIERLLPVVGVRHPISGITRLGPDKYSVSCDGRRFTEWTYEVIWFTVFRKDGRWFADKSSISKGVGYITSNTTLPTSRKPNQALERTATWHAITFQMLETVSMAAVFPLSDGRSALDR